tara:strand:+ start:1495 stop:1743 length:249 start_codon:yes stop_codon:yes gene_type:complete
MTKIILYPGNEINSKTVFEAPTNIIIETIDNKYNLSLNFSKGDTINSGENIYVEDSISIENLEIVNNIRQSDGFVTVEYTEI